MASKLTKNARGKDCQVNLYPYCNGGGETTVFAHANSEDKGWGLKSPDFWGAFCCSDCHDVIDGRRKTDISSEEITACFVRGIYRTLKIQIEDGLIKI
ncbi:MAG: hypothetical protein CMI54_01450 [Parcubacteria group bacterium]|nr:hypothetical protein [Parcubacteria group bacterium]|tara:strand:- start:794 stop:1087 length:294 start_codon:yes stop_codon:yes gene_type:complete